MRRHPIRVAFFTDSYAEANGVARLSRALEAAAARRGLPFLSVHGSDSTRRVIQDSVQRLALRRSLAAFRLEHDLSFDPLLWRHYAAVARVLREFRPDVIHVTGPSDVGQLGALLGHLMHVPMVFSWHTNLHQYAALRSSKWCRWLPRNARGRLLATVERRALDATLLFYRIPKVVLAPNDDLVAMLAPRTGKPAHLMAHGVDVDLFAPRPRDDDRSCVRIGFVGRLSAEKQVRVLAAIDRALRARGDARFQFVVIGDGSERAWLQQAMPSAEFPGVLEGERLARAYASLDLFAFPSRSETFGLAVLEAMASGVPVVAMAYGGPRFVVEHGISGWLARDEAEFIDAAAMLARDAALRRRLGAGARASALGWSWDAVLDRLYEVYDQALQQNARAA